MKGSTGIGTRLDALIFVCVFTVFERSRFTTLQRNGGYPHDCMCFKSQNGPRAFQTPSGFIWPPSFQNVSKTSFRIAKDDLEMASTLIPEWSCFHHISMIPFIHASIWSVIHACFHDSIPSYFHASSHPCFHLVHYSCIFHDPIPSYFHYSILPCFHLVHAYMLL